MQTLLTLYNRKVIQFLDTFDRKISFNKQNSIFYKNSIVRIQEILTNTEILIYFLNEAHNSIKIFVSFIIKLNRRKLNPDYLAIYISLKLRFGKTIRCSLLGSCIAISSSVNRSTGCIAVVQIFLRRSLFEFAN